MVGSPMATKRHKKSKNIHLVCHLCFFVALQFRFPSYGLISKALNAEGIPCLGGYHEQYPDGLFDKAMNERK